VVGFLISGRAARTGYVQRLAVHPDAHRNGVATALLVDSLQWMRRARLQRVFVNTHVENVAALTLYRAHGFVELPERLRVFEGPIPL
jgi:ribosomal protein S18 acetylase RimI-like enzyme